MRKRIAIASVLVLGVVAALLWTERPGARARARAPTREVAAASDAPTDGVEVPAPPAEPRLSGRVLEPDEVPAAGATVTAYAFGTGRTLTATTDADGAFDVLEAPAGALQLVVRHGGFGAASLRVVLPGEPILIRLSRGGGIRGRVVAEEGGTPVSPCRVAAFWTLADGQTLDPRESLLSQLLPAEFVIHATANTHADGTFDMTALAPGNYAILVDPDGFVPLRSRPVRVQADAVTDVLIGVLGTAEILVEVFDEESGWAIVDARFERGETRAKSWWSAFVPLRAKDRGDGTYGLQAGFWAGDDEFVGKFIDMRLRVSRDGYATRVLPFRHPDARDRRPTPKVPIAGPPSLAEGDRFRVALGRGATIGGHVWSSGRPAQGAIVLVEPVWSGFVIASGTAGPDGAFEITGVDAGEKLNAQVYDRTLAPIATVGLLLRNGERRTLEIGAPGTAAIEGHVVLGGAPATNTFVAVSGASDAMSRTGTDAMYRFEGLNTGRHEIAVSANDGYIKRYVDIEQGERVRLDIEPGALISGVVVDSRTNMPVKNASYLGVVARTLQSDSKDCALIYADGDGRFRLQVDPGAYQLDCQCQDVYAVERPSVDTRQATGSEVVLRVSRDVRGCRIDLALKDARTGGSVPDCAYEHISGSGRGRGSLRGGGGILSLGGLSPGLHRFRVWSDAHAPAETEITLDAGHPEVRREVILEPAEALRITEVGRDTEAARAGLRAGDTILACNGVVTPSIAAFHAALASSEGPAKIECDRQGVRRVVTVPKEDLNLRLENILLGR